MCSCVCQSAPVRALIVPACCERGSCIIRILVLIRNRKKAEEPRRWHTGGGESSAALRRLAGVGSLLVVAHRGWMEGVERVEAGSLSRVRSCWPDGDVVAGRCLQSPGDGGAVADGRGRAGGALFSPAPPSPLSFSLPSLSLPICCERELFQLNSLLSLFSPSPPLPLPPP